MSEAGLVWRERASQSTFVASAWTCDALEATLHTVLADPCISISLVEEAGDMRVVLRGPTTKPHDELLALGYTCTTIRLQPGVMMRGFSVQEFIDSSLVLSVDVERRFWLEGNYLQFPSFDNAELLVDQLYHLGLLSYEVSAAKALSARSYSRVIKRTTGLSPYRLQQLQRAHQALKLLKQGMPATMVAAELDFVDESHLTRVLKQFLGHTPKQLLYVPQAP